LWEDFPWLNLGKFSQGEIYKMRSGSIIRGIGGKRVSMQDKTEKWTLVTACFPHRVESGQMEDNMIEIVLQILKEIGKEVGKEAIRKLTEKAFDSLGKKDEKKK
jgi:hypothetical protein